jgi:quercetin dioxygenase-like cupin family protein
VNPHSIRVTLDNARVRVFEATLPPGAKENLHSHPASIVHVIEGGTVRNHFPDGSTKDATLQAGTSAYREPLVHWAENVGDTTVRLIVVELKDPLPVP